MFRYAELLLSTWALFTRPLQAPVISAFVVVGIAIYYYGVRKRAGRKGDGLEWRSWRRYRQGRHQI